MNWRRVVDSGKVNKGIGTHGDPNSWSLEDVKRH